MSYNVFSCIVGIAFLKEFIAYIPLESLFLQISIWFFHSSLSSIITPRNLTCGTLVMCSIPIFRARFVFREVVDLLNVT